VHLCFDDTTIPTNEFFMAMIPSTTHSTLRSQPWCENLIQQSSMKVYGKPKQNRLQWCDGYNKFWFRTWGKPITNMLEMTMFLSLDAT
jgi:hypothetical protein